MPMEGTLDLQRSLEQVQGILTQRQDEVQAKANANTALRNRLGHSKAQRVRRTGLPNSLRLRLRMALLWTLFCMSYPALRSAGPLDEIAAVANILRLRSQCYGQVELGAQLASVRVHTARLEHEAAAQEAGLNQTSELRLVGDVAG